MTKNKLMDFKGKVIIVTGAGRGIGRCIAQNYTSKGAKVVLAEKNPDLGSETEKTIVTDGGTSTWIKTDISIPGDIEILMRSTLNLYGTLDILINNACIAQWKSPYDILVEEWDEIINTNLRGAFLCSREAAKIMKENGGGSIVNIASTRAFMSEPNSEPYAASKGGIVALTHALAASFSQDHIRVNCISPGWIEVSDYTILREVDHHQHLSRRVGKPEDIARACLYLTDDGNDFINGTNIIIDGGMTRKMIYEP
jgi:NAD(P)-dependent dehydrogenase (short-subunit alcohol dehydrogenase family)